MASYLSVAVWRLATHQVAAEKSHIDKNGNPTYVQILEEFTNLGPIVDFSFVDLERHGQGQVVTCSGAFKDGSLRVVRNGIGIDEQAVIQLPGVKGLFSLRDGDASEMNKYLVVTFINETRILGFVGEDGDTLDEAEITVSTPLKLCAAKTCKETYSSKSRTRVFDWFRAMGL